jgi:hypothetical protein
MFFFKVEENIFACKTCLLTQYAAYFTYIDESETSHCFTYKKNAIFFSPKIAENGEHNFD